MMVGRSRPEISDEAIPVGRVFIVRRTIRENENAANRIGSVGGVE
jgi:hypothetical protein